MLKTSRKHFIQTFMATLGLSLFNFKKLLPSAFAQDINLSNDFDSNGHAWQNIKNLFPHTRNPKIRYFNTATVGPSSHQVIEKLCNTVKMINGDFVDGQQKLPSDGSRDWENHKKTLAQFINCSSEEIVLTRNTTEGVNIICKGLPKTNKKYILLTSTKEHVGNVAAWVNRSQKDGDMDIVTFSCNKLSQNECTDLIFDKLNALPDRPVILSIPHIASDGYRFPVEAIGVKISQLNTSRTHKIFYFIDGAQSLGMMPIDVKSYQCHAYAASGHKWLCGPKGTGVLYVHHDVQNFIQAQFVGAYSCSLASFSPLQIDLVQNANRYAYGTQNTQLFAGLAQAVHLFESIGVDRIQSKVLSLSNYFRQGLKQYNQSQSRFHIHDIVHADASSYSAMVTFAIEDRLNTTWLDSKDLCYSKINIVQINNQNIHLRLRHIHEDNLDGVRASFHIFHEQEDVDILLLSIKKYLALV
ncbi:aminotransferase class V-fold PLP-dependent enzyme [bacterium]|nr:aminotransferase class V-fold PLP-dependent enzyme [bacterium]